MAIILGEPCIKAFARKIWTEADTHAPLVEKLYVIGFALLVFRGVFGLSNMDFSALKVLTYATLLLFAVKILLTKYRLRELAAVTLLLILGAVVTVRTKSNGILISTMAIAAAKGIDIRRVFRLSFYALILGIAIVVCAAWLGLTQNTVLHDQRLGFIQRTSLGFIHPNILHAFFMIVCAIFLFLHFDRLKWFHFAGIALLNILLFLISGSRTGCLTVFIILALAIFISVPRWASVMGKYTWIMFLVITLSLLLFTFVYPHTSIVKIVNNFLQGRISQANYYLQHYSVHLFGSHIKELDEGNTHWHLMLDDGYDRLLINYGVLLTLLYLYANTRLLYEYGRKRAFMPILLLLTFAFAGISENYIVYITMNVSLLFARDLLFDHSLCENRMYDRLAECLSTQKVYRAAFGRFYKALHVWLGEGYLISK